MAPSTTHYSYWQYALILMIVIASFLYAAPNLYGEYPAIAIESNSPNHKLDQHVTLMINHALRVAHINYEGIHHKENTLLYHFASTDEQLKAKEIIQAQLGEGYVVALNLEPATPAYLKAIGAIPMKLGLDLRGGIHFLLQVDIDSVIKQRMSSNLRMIAAALRNEAIHYTQLTRSQNTKITLVCSQKTVAEKAYAFLRTNYNAFSWVLRLNNNENHFFSIEGTLSTHHLAQIRQETLEQAMHTLRNRVNELGIAEAIVQQQGESRISVDLPGIQDSTEAKNILGKTAALAFHLVEFGETSPLTSSQTNSDKNMLDARLLYYHGQSILLKSPVILKGSDIIAARAGLDDESNRAKVDVRLKGNNSLFTETTAANIGKPMGTVFIETKSVPEQVNGKSVIHYQTTRRLISVATITSALGNSFSIVGLSSTEEARTLALLLRAGSLPTPITIIEERQIGPSLGKQNIQMGKLSVMVGMALVMLFMALYYRLMGIIANLALLMNLVLMIAILSLLGATLTLPGMAGIVLTIGMAVDANVLIFERIREEMRRGMRTLASIHMGYEKAWTTIVDANMTTLIVMMILFSLGSGMIKGIAITITIGLLTSMLTAIAGTRVLVTLLYGNHPNKPLSIGINL